MNFDWDAHYIVPPFDLFLFVVDGLIFYIGWPSSYNSE